MKIYKNNKSGLAKVEYIDKYYKYEYTENITVPLYESDNTNYINKENNHYEKRASYQGGNNQIYVLNNRLLVQKITANIDVISQLNSYWYVKIAVDTNAGTYNLIEKNYDRNITESFKVSIEFDSPILLKSVSIHTDLVTHGASTWNRGDITVFLTSTQTKINDAAPDDYNVKKRVPKSYLINLTEE